jgi:hypothetical protein
MDIFQHPKLIFIPGAVETYLAPLNSGLAYIPPYHSLPG